MRLKNLTLVNKEQDIDRGKITDLISIIDAVSSVNPFCAFNMRFYQRALWTAGRWSVSRNIATFIIFRSVVVAIQNFAAVAVEVALGLREKLPVSSLLLNVAEPCSTDQSIS
jgi:hypothetical protein